MCVVCFCLGIGVENSGGDGVCEFGACGCVIRKAHRIGPGKAHAGSETHQLIRV